LIVYCGKLRCFATAEYQHPCIDPNKKIWVYYVKSNISVNPINKNKLNKEHINLKKTNAK
jgi:hypothetical protein